MDTNTTPGEGYQKLAGAAAETRLASLRRLMAEAKLDALVVRSGDEYLNEYVPLDQSLRAWITGFSGSVGDALVTRDQAFLFVDGRYHEQADIETDAAHWTVVKIALFTQLAEALATRIKDLSRAARAGFSVGFAPERVSVTAQRQLELALKDATATIRPTSDNLVARARGAAVLPRKGSLEPLATELAGSSVAEKLARVRERLVAASLDGLLVVALDEIAWLTNLRAFEIDYSATFRALAYVGRTSARLYVDPEKLSVGAGEAMRGAFELAAESGWDEALRASLSGSTARVGYDPETVTVAVLDKLALAAGSQGAVVEVSSPVRALKAIKTAGELKTLARAYASADRVVSEATTWLNREVKAGKRVTEAGFAEEVKRRFLAAGAPSLSFKVISAAGANGAVIHYSRPDPRRRIAKGELMLLDTGAYFDGFATDLTRTFLAGGNRARPTRQQRTIYTLVLKAAIRGMKARFPRGTSGGQLDALVRAPIWEAGYDYAHGTGHGIGVLVHEFPPRVASKSEVVLEAGMVFSIEPGLYLPGWGGVRIENLVTIEEDPKVAGFLRVVPLTFAPIDRLLVDSKMLSPDEKDWMRRWLRRAKPLRAARKGR